MFPGQDNLLLNPPQWKRCSTQSLHVCAVSFCVFYSVISPECQTLVCCVRLRCSACSSADPAGTPGVCSCAGSLVGLFGFLILQHIVVRLSWFGQQLKITVLVLTFFMFPWGWGLPHKTHWGSFGKLETTGKSMSKLGCVPPWTWALLYLENSAG